MRRSDYYFVISDNVVHNPLDPEPTKKNNPNKDKNITLFFIMSPPKLKNKSRKLDQYGYNIIKIIAFF